MEKVKIYTITHKKYWMPNDKLYMPLQVGFDNDLDWLRDNTGDNIASKNTNFSELTGLYWIWKNIDDVEYIGLDHYRRHFCLHRKQNKKMSILKYSEIVNLLNDKTIILPKKRNYFIETVYSQYIHAHHKQDLDITRDIIKRYHSEYLDAFDGQMNKRTLHLCNMFIMPKEIFDRYCQWLFDVLFRLEDSLDISSYSDYDKRVFGYVAERLLDVFVTANGYKVLELPYVFLEKQNWISKGINFLKRKYK